MIFGIGCDLCTVTRIEKSLTGPHGAAFAQRVYGPAEQQLLGLGKPLSAYGAERAAANFAAKEAFLKAAGAGLGSFALPEVEALRLESGAPVYVFRGQAAAWMAENGLAAHLTLSHEGGQALAFCVLERAGTV